MRDEDRVAFSYLNDLKIDEAHNLNGSRNNIAGIYNKRGTVLGMMPHPENAVEEMLGGIGGRPMFDGILTGLERLLK